MTAVEEQQAVTDIETLVEEKASDRIKEWTGSAYSEFINTLQHLIDKMYSVEDGRGGLRQMRFVVHLDSHHKDFNIEENLPNGFPNRLAERFDCGSFPIGCGLHITVNINNPNTVFKELVRNSPMVQTNAHGYDTAKKLGYDPEFELEDSLALTWEQFLDVTREYHTQLALEKIACGSLPVDSREMPF